MSARRARYVGLLVLLTLSFVLRAWNLDHDRRQHLHPDERHWSFVTEDITRPGSIGEYFDSTTSPLNPYNHRDSFVYGTFPLFATEATAGVLDREPLRSLTRLADKAGIDLLATDGSPRFDSAYQADLVGRLLSAVVDTLTVGLVFLLARRLWSGRVAWTAAVLQAVSVLHIQHAHFFGSEPWLACASTLAILSAVRLGQGGGRRWAVVCGLAIGLALSSKLNGAVVLVAPVVALGLMGWRRSWSRPTGGVREALVATSLSGALVLVVVAITYRVANPYAFDGLVQLDPRFTSDLAELARLQSGVDFPPNLQWVGRTPLLYPLANLFWWGLGPATAVLAALGAVLASVRSWRRREPDSWIPLAVLVSMVVLVATRWTPAMRYWMPVLPVVSCLAAVGAVGLWDLRPRKLPANVPRVAAATLVGLAVLWGLAFVNGVYGRDHSRIAASEWIADHVPPGSALSVQLWDDALPLRLPGVADFEYVQFEPFRTDSPEKVAELLAGLTRVDYVIESSERLTHTIPRVPARYPATTRYYEALFDGSLGFDLVATFVNEPQLFGIGIDDSDAEETFTVYDHPTVRIWRKTGRFEPATATRILDPVQAAEAMGLEPREAAANGLRLRPDVAKAQASGGTFREVFDVDGDAPTSTLPAVWWFLWFQIAAWSSVPWVSRLCARLPGRGYGLTKLAGPAVVTLVTWSLVARGLVDFDRPLAWGVLVAHAGAGGMFAWRWRGDLLGRWRAHRRVIVSTEAVFLVAFVAVVALRAAVPDLWFHPTGGEKPMELAQLTALTRTTTFPVADPWFAGGALNYYYMGWFLLAVPARAMGTLPEVSFNLGLAAYVAMAAAVAYGLGRDLAATMPRRDPTSPVGWRGPGLGGLATVGLVFVIGNLAMAGQVIQRLAGDRAGWDWWAVSRVHDGSFDITEFPAWSVLFGDLHPHVMGIAFVLAAFTVAFAYVRTAASRLVDRGRLLALAIALGGVGGLVHMVHTWDLPGVMVAAGLAVGAGAFVHASGWRAGVRRAILHAGVVGIVHWSVIRPYAVAGEIHDAALVGSPETTGPADHLTHLGVFAALALLFVAVRIGEERGRLPRRELIAGAGVSAVLTILVGDAAGHVVVAGSLVVLALLAALATAEVRGRSRPAVVAVTALFAGGVGLTALVDVVTLVDDVVRMNTVFKLTFHAWSWLAVAGGFTVWLVCSRPPPGPRWSSRGDLRTVSLASIGVALVAGGSFWIAAPERLDDRFSTDVHGIDGLSYLRSDPVVTFDGVETRLGDDLPLVEHLRREVDGTPTILEAVGPSYRWFGRMAILTGSPTVIGWEYHQVQQRRAHEPAVRERFAAVQHFFGSAGPMDMARLLLRHRVDLVIWGTLEQQVAGPGTRADLERLPGVEPSFVHGQHAIYRVDRLALWSWFAEVGEDVTSSTPGP